MTAELNSLPWELAFEPRALAPGLSLTFVYEPLEQILDISLRNGSDQPLDLSEVEVVATIDSPCVSGHAWLRGRTIGEPARVIAFGEKGAGRYASAESIVVSLPVKTTPVLFAGTLAPASIPVSFALECDPEERELRSLAIRFSLRDATFPPGSETALPPVLFADGRDPASLVTLYGELLQPANAAPEAGESGWSIPAPGDALPSRIALLRRHAPAGSVVLVDSPAQEAELHAAGFAPVPRTGPGASFAPMGGPLFPGQRALAEPDPAVALLPAWLLGGQVALGVARDLARDGGPTSAASAARCALTVAALCSGPIFLDASLLADDATRDLALAMLPHHPVQAAPLNPYESPVPAAWRANVAEGRSLLGVVNTGDAALWLSAGELLRPGEIAFSFFDGRMLGMGDVLLQPRDAVLWQVSSPGKTPRAVGDTGSIAFEGLFQRQVSGRIQLRNDGGRPRTVAVEARGQVLEVDLEPGEMRWFD